MSARTRRSLTLFWTALFVCSLLMQYANFAAAPPVAAVHDDGIFELEGNATDQGTPGDDWQNGTPGAADTLFIPGSVEKDGPDTTYFKGGGSKDHNDLPDWEWSSTDVAPDKDELLDVFAAVYEGADTIVYFGADKFDDSGDAQIGFWFFQDQVSLAADGSFNGVHTVGDVLVLSDFTNGGDVDLICVYEWNPPGDDIASGVPDDTGCDIGDSLTLVAAGAECDVSSPDGAFDVCAGVNPATENPGTASHPDGFETAPWAFLNKDGHTHFDKGQFFEGGINLSQLFGGDAPCFSTFLAETRSSQEVEAQLKDFALGSLDTCVPPTLTTLSSVSTADFGQNVSDTATLSGVHGPVTGTVDFFICTPTQVTAGGCEGSAGTQVGGSVTIVAGSATSANYTVGLTAAAVGKYCWRAEYNPAADSEYLATSHTNSTTECFTVAPATIDIDKVANPAGPVSAGDVIGFDITVTNNGDGTALGVSVSDNLPSGVDWTLGAVTGDTTGVSCGITGSVGSEVLTCTDASMAADDSFSVRVTATTDATDCGTINNTASVTTTNDGSDSDPASVQVLCPDVKVTKTPDGGSVNAGDPITWTIKVENLGPGVAKGVVLTDNLPGGIDWSEAEADCSIAGAVGSEVLTCTVGDLASGASKTYTVTGTTDAQDCGIVNNTGSATATNEPSNVLANNSDSGSVTVLCAQIDIDKVANPVGPVNAGDEIGFDIVVSNNGAGTANNVAVTDNLPGGVDWTLGAVTGDTTGVSCNITGSVGSEVLSCTDASMPGGDSFSVHVSADTDATDCGTINNTASVTTTNDGSDSDDASVVVQCPDVKVTKTPDGGSVNAGENITWTIKVENLGPGTAYGVVLTDNLPSGIDWSESEADCSIAGAVGSEVLTCTVGDLASGASKTYTVTGTTDAADCGVVNNTGSATATNEPSNLLNNNSDSGSVTVLCAEIDIDKVANPVGPVNAGDQIGFDITVSNNGAGAATNVAVTDNLPAGVDWTLGAVTGDTTGVSCNITGSVGSEVLSCTDASMAAGDSFSVHVSGTTDAADCGTINNTASVTTGNDGSDSDGASVVVQCPDVKVTKTGNGTVSAGEVVSFSIKVENLGPGAAYDVSLSDNLPSGIDWTLGSVTGDTTGVSCGITGAVGSEVLSCTDSLMAAGDDFTVTVSGESDAADCGEIPNTATVGASNEPSNVLGNNVDSDTVIVLCADIMITKSANPAGPVSAGDGIGFDIVVTNGGAGTAFNVLVTDNLPGNAGLDWSIDSVSGDTTGVSCGIAGALGSEVLTCTVASMASGDSFTVRVESGTTAATCGLVDNTATVTTSNDGSDEDDSSVMVECPDVVVVKSATNSPINAGDDAIFAITVSNAGPGEAKNVVLSDNLPSGIDWALGSVNGDTDGVACGITGAVGSEVLTCTDDSMAAGDAFAVTVSGDTGPEDCGTIPNLASATAGNEAQGDTENNSDDATIEVLCAEIDIEKVADDDEVIAGDQIGFVITVTNDGEGTAYDVEVMDVLPGGVTWTIDGPANGFSIVGGNLVFGPADLAAGASVSVHIVATTDDTDCGVIDNTASVTTSNDGEDEASDSVTVRCPEIDLDKSHNDADGIVGKGQTVTYTLDVTVVEGPVTNAVVTDELPVGQTYVDGSQDSVPASTSFEVSADGRTLTWTFASLDDAGAQITYDVTIDADAPIGDQVNVAEVCVSELPACEGDDELVTVPDLTIIKTLADTGEVFESDNPDNPLNGTPVAQEGDILDYTLTYDLTNGPVHNGVITDTLPVGLAYVTGSATNNAEFTFVSFDPATRTLTWTAPIVSADGSVSYKVQVLDGAAELPQPLVNVATIDSDETPPDEDQRQVLVAEPPLVLTPPPTLPPTSMIDAPSQGASNPGFSLMLVLLGLAGFALAVGFITPVPERVRRRDRR